MTAPHTHLQTHPFPMTDADALNNRRFQRQRVTAILCSLIVGAGLLVLKFAVYRITMSSAVLSDALESIINVVASAFALISILMAARPPDEDHPYGHGKIEYFSSGFEGALIVLAAIGIFRVGILHLINPQPISDIGIGVLILCIASGINLVLGMGLIRTGRRTDSITLVADGKHILTDVITSAGVIIGLALVHFTGWLWIDGAVACVVGVNILFTGAGLVRQAFSGLMDTADPELLKRLADILNRSRHADWIDIHQLRASKSGHLTQIDLHLILPRDMTLEAAHVEAKALEMEVVSAFHGNAMVLVHMDPCEDVDCETCDAAPCDLRSADAGEPDPWTPEKLVRTHHPGNSGGPQQ